MSLTFYPDKPAEWLEALAVVKLRIDDENLPSEQRETMSDTLGSAHTRALDSDTRERTLDAQLSAARGVRDKKTPKPTAPSSASAARCGTGRWPTSQSGCGAG